MVAVGDVHPLAGQLPGQRRSLRGPGPPHRLHDAAGVGEAQQRWLRDDAGRQLGDRAVNGVEQRHEFRAHRHPLVVTDQAGNALGLHALVTEHPTVAEALDSDARDHAGVVAA